MSLTHVLDEISRGNFAAALLLISERMALRSESSSDECLIRSDLLRRLGYEDASRADIQRALLAAPLNPRALLRACQSGLEADACARLLLASRTATPADRKQSLAYLRPDDGAPLMLPQLFADHVRITVCAEREILRQIMADTPLQDGDRCEPLAAMTVGDAHIEATDFLLALPPTGTRMVSLRHAEEVCFSASYNVPHARPAAMAPVPAKPSADLFIIIPIHNGAEAVARCLDSVFTALPKKLKTRVVLVDDASSDKGTRKLIDKYARRPHVRLIRHEANLGFVRATNSALRRIGPGPVLLLNSDTYVPKDSFKRLLRHLEAEADIGTVTPFSNNGGSFSLPRPRASFAMPTPKQCEELALRAHAANAGKRVDMLHGNGFAMLISAQCRAKVGLLSEAYEGGYYEEVDYCLRARALGFRNVCATDCFVGHFGSLSFGAAKRRLAAANLDLLERIFPSYRMDFERQVILDPLKPSRDAILRDSPWKPEPVLAIDPPVAQTIQLPLRIVTRGQPRVIIPFWGPISASLLNRSTPQIHWIEGAMLSAHGLTFAFSHGLRAIFGLSGPASGILALLEGERPLASLDLALPLDLLPADALRTLESIAMRSTEMAHEQI